MGPAEQGGEWEMRVSATRDIEAGEELLLSYGARAVVPCGALLLLLNCACSMLRLPVGADP